MIYGKHMGHIIQNLLIKPFIRLKRTCYYKICAYATFPSYAYQEPDSGFTFVLKAYHSAISLVVLKK